MKTLFLTLLMAAAAIGAQAQEMEKSIYDFAHKYGEKYIKNTNKKTWVLADGKTEGYRITYYFEMPHKAENVLESVKKAYAKDKEKAYNIYERRPDGPADFGTLYVPYGKDNQEYYVTFGWWKNRDFRIVCLRDKDNPAHRLITDLEWYDEDGVLKGEMWVIYGDDPQRVTYELNEPLHIDSGTLNNAGIEKTQRLVGTSDFSFTPDSVHSEADCQIYLLGLYSTYMAVSLVSDQVDKSYVNQYQMIIANRLLTFQPVTRQYLSKKSMDNWLSKMDEMIERTEDNAMKQMLQMIKTQY